MQEKQKSNMVCLLVGSEARVNNIANQTKSSNKIFKLRSQSILQFHHKIICKTYRMIIITHTENLVHVQCKIC